jgi:chorismate mutase
MPGQMSERSDLAEQIARCRRLANAITDEATVQLLLAMAIEYELRLDRISQRQTP